MTKLHIYRFKVKGRFPFPLDMLRYDGCIPASESASGLIGDTFDRPTEPVTIELRTGKMTTRNWEPTAARWASFGWEIVGEVNRRDA